VRERHPHRPPLQPLAVPSLLCLAFEIRRVIRAPASLVGRNLRVRTDRPRAIDFPFAETGCDELIRSLLRFDFD
jgi:hypothetical protein